MLDNDGISMVTARAVAAHTYLDSVQAEVAEEEARDRAKVRLPTPSSGMNASRPVPNTTPKWPWDPLIATLPIGTSASSRTLPLKKLMNCWTGHHDRGRRPR